MDAPAQPEKLAAPPKPKQARQPPQDTQKLVQWKPQAAQRANLGQPEHLEALAATLAQTSAQVPLGAWMPGVRAGRSLRRAAPDLRAPPVAIPHPVERARQEAIAAMVEVLARPVSVTLAASDWRAAMEELLLAEVRSLAAAPVA